jgi:uncharacterized protein YggE
MRLTFRVLGAFTLLSLAAGVASAQSSEPVIVVSASAEVEIVPDRAGLRVAVETRGRTAAEAAEANGRVQTAVLAAIRRAGVAQVHLRTTSLHVAPVYEYPREGGRPTVVGYSANNAVDVQIVDLSTLAAVIDAALGAGATNLHGPHFSLADDAGPRRQALELAVRRARADAESIASAAGVEVRGVLEIRTGDSDSAPVELAVRRLEVASLAASTPVESGRISVQARVTVRFAISQP